jgi:hypothetical protein
VCCMWIFWLYK